MHQSRERTDEQALPRSIKLPQPIILLATVANKHLFPNHLPLWLLIEAALGWQAVVGLVALIPAWRSLCCFHRVCYDETFVSKERTPGLCDFVLLGILLLHHCLWRPIAEAML